MVLAGLVPGTFPPGHHTSLFPSGRHFKPLAVTKVGQTRGQPQLNFPPTFFRLLFHRLLPVVMETVYCLLPQIELESHFSFCAR